MHLNTLKISLVLAFIAAPAIFSACFRCSKTDAADKHYALKQIALRSIHNAAEIDSVAHADSSGLFIEFGVEKLAAVWSFSMGGELMAKKCPQGVSTLNDQIDSLSILSVDSNSVAYPPNTNLNACMRVSWQNNTLTTLPVRNQSAAFWQQASPFSRIFFTYDPKLTERKVKAVWKLSLHSGTKVFSKPFYLIGFR